MVCLLSASLVFFTAEVGSLIRGEFPPNRFPGIDRPRIDELGNPAFGPSVDDDDRLRYGSYLGGHGADFGYGVTTDDAGFVYVVGTTERTDWILAPERASAPESLGADAEAFITKIDPVSGQVVFSKTFGGSGVDIAYGVAVIDERTVAVCGLTTSADFGQRWHPRPDNGVHETFPDYDAFLSEVDVTTGIVQTWSWGGRLDDIALKVALSPGGFLYVIGETKSTDFPTTPDAFQQRLGGDKDAFLTVVTSGQLQASTLIGGFGEDNAYDIEATDDRIVFVGRSSSPNFPVTAGTYDTTHNGSYDSYITVMTPDARTLIASTFFGAPRRDEAHGVALDAAGAIYVAGVARSEDFPVTPNAADPIHNGAYDGYIARFDSDLRALDYSTFLGGGEHDVVFDLDVDEYRRAAVTGITYSPDLETTPGALSPRFNGFADSFLVVAGPSGEEFAYASYLGGSRWEEGARMAMRDGLVHIVGSSYSPDVPLSSNAFDSSINGGVDAIIHSLVLRPPTEGYVLSYGPSWPGTDREPEILSSREPMVGEDLDLVLRSSLAPPSSSAGLLLIGGSPAQIPTPLGGTLLVEPKVSVAVDFGQFDVPLKSRVPNDPTLVGVRISMQLLVFDEGASHGLAFSRALTLGFGDR